MKKNNNNPAFILMAAVMFFSTAGALAEEFLSAEKVNEVYSDMTVKGVHLKKGYSYSAYFSPEGEVTQIRDGETVMGKWRIDDEGRHCIKWKNRDSEFCRHVYDNKDGSYTKVKLKGEKSIPVIMHRDFTQGNKL